MGNIKSAFGDPTHENGEGDVDRYQGTVSADSNGDGSTTLSHDEDFDDTPNVLSVDVVDNEGEAYRSAGGASQTTVTVAGAPASTDVEVVVVLAGTRSK